VKILVCHNYYQQPGGEDRVFDDEGRLLASRGHELTRFTRHNDAINGPSRWKTAAQTLWNRQTYHEVRQLIRRRRPDVMHCTNTFPMLSPSIYYAARAEDVPVVQSLHNYRSLCTQGSLLRDGRICEDCLGRLPWRSVVHACYRDSRAGAAVIAAMLSAHRFLRTWNRHVNRYIVLTEFSRRKFLQGGLPPERVSVKPNFLDPDPGPGPGGGYAVFVGRLSPEKGLDTLLEAWRRGCTTVPLRIIGDGPLTDRVKAAAAGNAAISWLGRRSPEEVLSILGEALCLVLPSICYEHCPLTLIEAFAKGTPVIASRLGAMGELVDHRRTGLHFGPADPDDLAAKVAELARDPDRGAGMRRAARRQYESRFTAQRNYEMLMDIYGLALDGRRPPGQRRTPGGPSPHSESLQGVIEP